jgi:hypothetical protein
MILGMKVKVIVFMKGRSEIRRFGDFVGKW